MGRLDKSSDLAAAAEIWIYTQPAVYDSLRNGRLYQFIWRPCDGWLISSNEDLLRKSWFRIDFPVQSLASNVTSFNNLKMNAEICGRNESFLWLVTSK
jgi:hypothetical protein